MTKLAIITTHPIQYYAPLFRLLSEEKNFSVKVFYTWSQSQERLHDPDFGFEVNWDVPLLSGYDYTFVKNIAAQPGSRSYNGILNPTLNQEIEDWEADAVLVIGWAFNSHLKAMRFFHGRIPVLFRGDSNLIDEPRYFSIKKLLRRLFLRWVYRHVNYALYVGRANKAYYLAHGMKQEQLFFAPHAIDNTRFADNEGEFETESRGWRVKLGIAANDFVFFVCRETHHKKRSRAINKGIY